MKLKTHTQHHLSKIVVESDDWRQRENANIGCCMSSNHTKLTYEDQTFLTLNANCLLNKR
jgi:hypothetical protein